MEEMMPFADAHCHLELFDDPSSAVEEARKSGVGIIITAGSNASSNVKMLELAKGGVYGVAGISPDFSVSEGRHIEELAELIKMNKNIIGIGEIGLDSTIIESVAMEKQKEAFEKQLEVAKLLEIPVVLHARKAIDQVIKILEEKEVEKAVFHFFEGNEEHARMAEKKGYLISIPPGESSRRKRVIKAIGLNSIVAETDSPAVGKSPADVVKVIQQIAELKRITLEEAGEQITKTIKEYFYI